jgi:hypothetical protein
MERVSGSQKHSLYPTWAAVATCLQHWSATPLVLACYPLSNFACMPHALQLQKRLGFGSYKSAWLLCGKLRHAMVAPDRSTPAGLVEIDELQGSEA